MNGLTQAQIRTFSEEGIFLLKGLLDKEELAACFTARDWSVRNPGPSASGLLPGTRTAFQDLCNPASPTVHDRITERRTLTLRYFGERSVVAQRPGAAGPFYADIRNLEPGEPFRHPRFPLVRAGLTNPMEY